VEWVDGGASAPRGNGIGDHGARLRCAGDSSGHRVLDPGRTFGDAVTSPRGCKSNAGAGRHGDLPSVKEALSEGPGEPLFDLGRLRFKNDDCPFRAFALGGDTCRAPASRSARCRASPSALVNLKRREADAYLAAGVVDDVIPVARRVERAERSSPALDRRCSGRGADP